MDLLNYASGDESSPDDSSVVATPASTVSAVAVNAAPTVLYNPSTTVTLYGMPAVRCRHNFPAVTGPSGRDYGADVVFLGFACILGLRALVT
jgi:hypothetical protein